jgi:hypothetical protein
VIVAAPGAASSVTAEALAGQSVAPADVLRVTSARELGAALTAAARSDQAWVWVLDDGVVPDTVALERLLDAVRDELGLISSKVTTPDGSLDADSLPIPEIQRGERVLDALDRRQVALRVARRGSLLVRPEALREAGGVDRFERDRVWSARLLGRRPGVLEPRSTAVRAGRGTLTGPSLHETLALLASVAPRDRPWFLAHATEQALSARRRARS